MSQIQLYALLDDRKLVVSPTNLSTFRLGELVQNDKLPLSVQLLTLDPDGGKLDPTDVIEEQRTVRVALVRPDSTSPDTYAVGNLVWDSETYTYTGTLGLNTTEIADLIGAAASASATLELEVIGEDSNVTFQQSVTVKPDGIKGEIPISISGTGAYLTSEEIAATYLSQVAFAAANVARTTDAAYVAANTGTFGIPVHVTSQVAGTEPNHPYSLTTKAYVDNLTVATAGYGLSKTGTTISVDPGTIAPRFHSHFTGTLIESGDGLFFSEARVNATGWIDPDSSLVQEPEYDDDLNYAIAYLKNVKLSKLGGDMTGVLGLPIGSEAAPSLVYSGDTDTGVFFSTGVVAMSLSGGEVARFSGSGLHIGSTTPVGAKLTVNGNTNALQAAVVANTSQTVDIFRIYDPAGETAFAVSRYGGLSVVTDGISAVAEKGLSVTATSQTGAATLSLINDAGGDGASFELRGSSHASQASNLVIGQNLEGSAICFETYEGEAMRVAAGGNVGIGVTSPTVPLQVAGAITASGTITGAVVAATSNVTAAGVQASGDITAVGTLAGKTMVLQSTTSASSLTTETSTLPATAYGDENYVMYGPAIWVPVKIGSTTYKMPLWQV